MNYKYRVGASILFVFIGVVLIVISILISEMYVLIIGLILMVVSVFIAILIASLEVFDKDKQIDISKLKAQGLHVISCKECGKSNVKEDIYCIFCGDKLENNDE